MTRRSRPLDVVYGERFQRAFTGLAPARRRACTKAIETLIFEDSRPGLRAKPILPDKHFFEARISGGDRVIFRIEAGTIFLYDVVKHDDIERYGRRPRT